MIVNRPFRQGALTERLEGEPLPRLAADNEIRERIMTSHLDAFVVLTKQFAVEEQLAGSEQQEDAAREMDDGDDSFNRRDFVMLITSFVILVFGMWWVAPW